VTRSFEFFDRAGSSMVPPDYSDLDPRNQVASENRRPPRTGRTPCSTPGSKAISNPGSARTANANFARDPLDPARANSSSPPKWRPRPGPGSLRSTITLTFRRRTWGFRTRGDRSV
jgi:hypothetical protein